MLEIKKSIEQGFSGKPGGLYDILKQLQNMAILTPCKVFYVWKGGNGQGGESWETAYPTITEAITEHTRYRTTIPSAQQSIYDYIIIAPATYDENITALPFSCNMIGLGHPGTDKHVELHPSAGIPIAGTVSGLRLINMRFEAVGAVDLLDFNICNNVEILNCTFACADADNVAAISTQNSSYLTIRDCRFDCLLATAGFAYCLYFGGGSDKYLASGVIENNVFSGMDAAGTAIYIASDCTASETIIRNNIIKLTGAGTGIDDNNDNAMVLDNVVFHVSGTPYDINTSWSKNNYASDAGTATIVPDLAQF